MPSPQPDLEVGMSPQVDHERVWLDIKNLDSWRGASHIVQGVNLRLGAQRVVIVGRNGMGKSTLCDAIAGMLVNEGGRIHCDSIRLDGTEISTLPTHKISEAGLGYVPQGRRVFPSLTAEEHLRLAQRKNTSWPQERVYTLFARLAERRKVHAGVLSGGEQQMLAIGRALVTDPKVLLMDEPSEGLAPAVVEQLVQACIALEAEGIRSLVIEQNLHVACALADDIVVISNGRVVANVPAVELANNSELQQRYLGVSSTA